MQNSIIIDHERQDPKQEENIIVSDPRALLAPQGWQQTKNTFSCLIPAKTFGFCKGNIILSNM